MIFFVVCVIFGISKIFFDKLYIILDILFGIKCYLLKLFFIINTIFIEIR